MNSDSLFALLRFALGVPLQNDAEQLCALTQEQWQVVFELAVEQNVMAIAYDGLSAMAERVSTSNLTSRQADEDVWIDFVTDWGANVYHQEQSFHQQWVAACRLASQLHENGLRTFVLKGPAVGACYPVPQHRQCGDLDIYVDAEHDIYDDDSTQDSHQQAYDKVNELMKACGREVSYDLYKHSKFGYEGLTVENHQFCIPIRGCRKNKQLEYILESRICHGRRTMGDSCLEYPTSVFNLLFLTVHGLNHFLGDGISLRHVCDWGMFLKKSVSQNDWDAASGILQEYGLLRFASSMTRLAHEACGIDFPWMVDYTLQPQDERLLDDIFVSANREHMNGSLWRQRRILIKNKWDGRWKYRAFTDTTAIGELLRNAYGFAFDRNPKVKAVE